MAHEPFLLDPSFDGTLDSDAFRAHFLRKAQRARVPRIILPLILLVPLTPSLIFLIMGLVSRDPTQYAISAGLSQRLLGMVADEINGNAAHPSCFCRLHSGWSIFNY